MDSSPPKPFFHDRVVQGGVRYFLDRVRYSLSEPLPRSGRMPEYRASASVSSASAPDSQTTGSVTVS
jgi:hypothetical protein